MSVCSVSVGLIRANAAMTDLNVRNSSLVYRRWFPVSCIAVASIVFVLIVTDALGESQDWQNYDRFFDALRVFGITADGTERLEIGFRFLVLGLMGFPIANLSVFALIAAISILMKSISINAFSGNRTVFFFSVLFYLCCFAALHEMTQVRVAIAIGVLFLAYWSLLSGRTSMALVLASAAPFFHISTVVMLPLLFFIYLFDRGKLLITRLKVIGLSALAFSLTATLIATLFFFFEDILLIVEAYLEEGFGDQPTNPFSATILLSIAMCVTGLLLWREQTPHMRYVIFLQTTGVALFYATIEFQVVAFRVNELIQSFWVLYVAAGLSSAHSLVRLTTICFAIIASAWYAKIYFFGSGFFI